MAPNKDPLQTPDLYSSLAPNLDSSLAPNLKPSLAPDLDPSLVAHEPRALPIIIQYHIPNLFIDQFIE